MLQTDSIIKKGINGLREVTGLSPSGVTGFAKENGGWRLTAEMVEKRSIPESMDILGSYDVWLDPDGNLTSFERRRLRKRGDVESA